MSKQRYNGSYLPERYIANPRPEQVASHILQIYSFKDLFWHAPNKQYLVPAGRLHNILSVDLGAVLPDMAEIVNAAEHHKSRKKYPKEENLKGSRKFRLPEAFRYLDPYIISAFEIQDDSIFYSFDLRKEAIDLNSPLEFHITEYLAENKEIVAISREKVLVWAKKWKNRNVPAGDFELRYFDSALFKTKSDFTS